MRIEGSDTKYQAPQPQMDRNSKVDVEKTVNKVEVKGLTQENAKYETTADERVDSGKRVTSIGEKALIKAIERANKKLEGVTTEFEFKVHEKTKQINIKVLNKETGELIREIPPEKVLDMVAHMWEMAGILIDERR